MRNVLGMRSSFLASVAVVGLLLALAGQVGAQTSAEPNSSVVTFWSGEQMLSYCKGGAVRDGCTGYAMGVADTAAEASAAGSIIGPFRVCRPEEVTASQARDVIVQFLQAHPAERRDHSAAGLALQALAAAWPCP